MQDKKNIFIIIILVIVAIAIMLVSIFFMTSVPKVQDENKETIEIKDINPETGEVIYKTDEDIEKEKEVGEILKEELISYSDIKDNDTEILKNNKDGELLSGAIKDEVYKEMNEKLYDGNFLKATEVLTRSLEIYSIDETSADIISYARDINYVVPLNIMELAHAQDRLQIIENDKVFAIALLFSRADIQLASVPDESLIVNGFDEAFFVEELEATDKEVKVFNELHYKVSVTKYLFNVGGEEISSFVLRYEDGSRISGGFYYVSDNPSVPYTRKINWE